MIFFLAWFDFSVFGCVHKNFYIIFLSIFVIRNFGSVVLKMGGITPLGAIFMGKGAIKPKEEIRRKQDKEGKNAQPLINR